MLKVISRDLLIYAAAATMVVIAVALISRAQADAPRCPDAAAKETTEDCPWAAIARQLIAEADGKGNGKLAERLKKLAPELDAALVKDAGRKSLKTLWGRSINFDEYANAIIVHPAIIDLLNQGFGLRSASQPIKPIYVQAPKTSDNPAVQGLGRAVTQDSAGHDLVHAGLEHTYGYLLSVLHTSFGYKRARWVRGEIESGFGLKSGLLGPNPPEGSLFANVTYFAGQIAFRDDNDNLAVLKKESTDLPPSLVSFDYSKLKPVRLEETVTAKDSGGEPRKVILRTDLVPFTQAPKASQKNSHLLVYSVSDASVIGDRLITAFPVEQSFVDKVVDTAMLGDQKPVQTRYNAFVEGVSGAKLTGTRTIKRTE